MTLNVFPMLPGLAWEVQKSPQFNTVSHRAVSGYEVRTAFRQYPLWTFSLAYEFLRDGAYAELEALMGFFLQQQGSFAAFGYRDPSDNAAVNQGGVLVPGTNASFLLTRVYGGFAEPVQNFDGTPSIFVGGVQQTVGPGGQCQIDPTTGIVTFAVTPPFGSFTWTGSFFYRVRFASDSADFNEFLYQLYELKQIALVGSPSNKV